MFWEVIKWTSRVFLGNITLFEAYIAYHKINLLATKCKRMSFDISLKNILNILRT
jgi:hypothetical protein